MLLGASVGPSMLSGVPVKSFAVSAYGVAVLVSGVPVRSPEFSSGALADKHCVSAGRQDS